MKALLVRLLLLTLVFLALALSQGCNVTQLAKEAAASAAQSATKAALAEGETRLRGLSSDIYKAAKEELVATGNLTAMKAGEIVGDSVKANLGDTAASATDKLALSLLQKQGVTNEKNEVIKAEGDLSTFQKWLLGLVGTAVTAVGGGAYSHASENRRKAKVDRKRYEQELRNTPVPIHVVNGAGKIHGEETPT